MKEMLSKVEVWEQSWARFEADHEVTLDIDLKLGALMKMLPQKELDVVKLKPASPATSSAGRSTSGSRASSPPAPSPWTSARCTPLM